MTINPLIAAKLSFRAAVRRAAVAACLLATSVPAALADTSGGGEIHPPGLPCGYTVEVIERPECPWPLGPALIWVQGLNNSGTVVGYRRKCIDDTWDQAWVWHSGDTTPTDLPVPPDIVSSQAYDISDNNVIVGAFRRFAAPWRGFVYDMNTGEWTELEPVDPTGDGMASANAINNAGVVAGTRSIGESEQPYNAFTWSREDGYTDLGVMEGPNSAGWFIHENGLVAGWTGQKSTNSTGFVTEDEKTMNIGPIDGGDTSYIRSMNSHGTLVGAGRAIDNTNSLVWQKGYTWTKGDYAILDPLPNYQFTGAKGIDDEGFVVGFSVTWPGPLEFRATVWVDGVAFDLSALLATTEDIVLEEARAVNGGGQILADGKVVNAISGFLLTPIDTPLGDLSGDCEVGADDLGLLLSEWNKKDSPADLTGDGTVGGADLGVLLSNWTK